MGILQYTQDSDLVTRARMRFFAAKNLRLKRYRKPLARGNVGVSENAGSLMSTLIAQFV